MALSLETKRLCSLGLSTLLALVYTSSHAAPIRLTGDLKDTPEQLGQLLGLDDKPLSEQLAIARKLGRCDAAPVPRTSVRQEQRERRLLDDLGYCVKELGQSREVVAISLASYPVVRKVYLSGNWPLFEEGILRRLRFRPGQRIPAPGPGRDEASKRERARIRRYLSRHGYPLAQVMIRFSAPSREGQVAVSVRLKKGRSYRVGAIDIIPMGLRREEHQDTRSIAAWQPALSTKTIRDIFVDKLLFWRRAFSTERFKQNTEALIERYHRRGYAGVRVKATYEIDPKRAASEAVRIVVRIQERKRVVVRYVGNSALSNSDLDKALTIFTAGAYDDYELHQSANALVARYRAEGYLQTRIRFTRSHQRDAQGRAHDLITFTITEGPRFRVREVQFSGNKRLKAAVLRAQIKTVPFPFLGYFGLGEGGYVTPTQIEQDARRLKQFYEARGFPQAKVSGEVAPHPALLGHPGALAAAIGTDAAASGSAYVRFSIEEGPHFLVEYARIEGVKGPALKQLAKGLALRPGRPFTSAELRRDSARIIRYYAERGHPYTQVQTFDDLAEDNTKVGVHLIVRQSKAVRFGGVFLRGNFRTRTFVVMKALAFQRGEVFDIRKLEASEKALRRLEIFNSVRIQLLDLPDQPSVVHVLIHVDERYDDYGVLEVGAGGSTDNPFFGSLAYRWGNLWGVGARLELRGEAGPEIQSANLNIFYPNTLGSYFATDLRFFVRNELTARLGDIFTYGASLAVSRELFTNTRAALRYDIRQIETSEPLNRPTGPTDEGSTRPVTNRTGSLSSTLTYDGRDNFLAPRRGIRLEAALRFASEYLGGTDDFFTLRGYGQAFAPLPFGMTFAFGVRYDHGFPLGGAVVLPKTERYFAGGDTTIRGIDEDRAFAERIVSPYDPLTGSSYVKVLPQGGNIRLLTNVELQFPIYQRGILGLPVYGAFFSDNGFVTNSLARFSVGEFRHSIGYAIRLVTPVGFLSFEHAFPLDPEVGDAFSRLHFNFGFIL